MPEPVTAILVTMLGAKALALVSSAVEDHAKDLVKGLFEKGEKIVLGKKEKNALEDAYRSALTNACMLLVGDERWADEVTRELLRQRAVDDKDPGPRSQALMLLVGDERWADEVTRELLSQRAVDDKDPGPRSQALMLLAGDERWAEHEETLAARQSFTADSIRDVAEPEKRGEVACFWFGSTGSSDPLADAKSWVFSRDVDGVAPFLDPLEPVSDKHLAEVAGRAGLSDEQLAEMVEQMNTTLGWDIRTGLSRLREARRR